MSNLPSITMGGLTTVLRNHHASFSNAVLVVLTLGGEQVFRVAAFNCPCSQPDALLYGLSFFLAPALVLLALGVMVNNMTWRLLQGCAYRSAIARHGYRRASFRCFLILGKASVAPVAWMFVTLLEGSYYVCMMSETPCEANSETNRGLSATSQVISWIFLVAVVGIALTVMLVSRCSDRLTFTQSSYMQVYRDTERQRLEAIMQEEATKLANANIEAFFKQEERQKDDWDIIAMTPFHGVDFVPNSNELVAEPFFTPLHRWAHDATNRNST